MDNHRRILPFDISIHGWAVLVIGMALFGVAWWWGVAPRRAVPLVVLTCLLSALMFATPNEGEPVLLVPMAVFCCLLWLLVFAPGRDNPPREGGGRAEAGTAGEAG